MKVCAEKGNPEKLDEVLADIDIPCAAKLVYLILHRRGLCRSEVGIAFYAGLRSAQHVNRLLKYLNERGLTARNAEGHCVT